MTTTTLKINFILERETKGAARYMEVDASDLPLSIEAGAKIGTLYIRKSAFAGGPLAQKLTLTVEPRS